MATAVATDLLFGEPPTPLHPTVWMGHLLGSARQWHRRRPRSVAVSLAAGAATLGAGALAAGAAGLAIDRALIRCAPARCAPAVGRIASGSVAGVLLKPALSLRGLLAAGLAVERALRRDDLPGARSLLAWHLVSRDTSRLTASEIAGAAIESLAENLSDGFVAPLLAYTAGGFAGAYAYRLVNTADAMLGYRTEELEWFGKAAAHADDVCNLVPARVTALLVALAAPAGRGSAMRAARIATADAHRTPSPNAGWPMAAMAGALDVRLDKRRAAPALGRLYVLHATGRVATVTDLARARRVVAAAAALAVVALALTAPDRHRRRGHGGRRS